MSRTMAYFIIGVESSINYSLKLNFGLKCRKMASRVSLVFQIPRRVLCKGLEVGKHKGLRSGTKLFLPPVFVISSLLDLI